MIKNEIIVIIYDERLMFIRIHHVHEFFFLLCQNRRKWFLSSSEITFRLAELTGPSPNLRLSSRKIFVVYIVWRFAISENSAVFFILPTIYDAAGTFGCPSTIIIIFFSVEKTEVDVSPVSNPAFVICLFFVIFPFFSSSPQSESRGEKKIVEFNERLAP